MDKNKTYMNVNFTKTDTRSPSGAEPDVSYAELNVKSLSAPRVRTDGGGLKSIYSELNFQKEEPRIEEDEDPPIASGPGGLSTIAEAGAHIHEPKEIIGNRQDRKIWLFCLVMFALVAIVVGLSIHVKKSGQSLITSERDCRRLWERHQEMNRTRQYQQQFHELNSTLESRRTCLKNLSALNNNLTILENNLNSLNSDLSDLNRTYSDLYHQFNQHEMKYKNINKTKTQICQYLTRRREPTCPQIWIKIEGRCYFISEIAKSYDGARQHCSELDSRLLEINSSEEKNFISNAVNRSVTYWIGKCGNGNLTSVHLFEMNYESLTCHKCRSYKQTYSYSCKMNHRYICEKSARFYPDIPEEIRGFCQQPVGPTSIK